MTPRARKTFSLSATIMALALVHFYLAYHLLITNPTSHFNFAAAIFIVLGTAQVGLGVIGMVFSLRRK